MAIRILDANTISKISAGEVVERPSSVVKELMENSIDAGAKSITVEIRDGGISYLRVTDNGCGIPFSEARLAFENHATSKLRNEDSLWDIRTLGFRGEALPSIAAVSKLTMNTRTKNADYGAKVEIEGGNFLGISEAGVPEGTTIIMRDLFYNLPVRRKFLKKPQYEQSLVSDIVQKMILGNPGVAVRYISNGKTAFSSIGDGDLRHAALTVFGRDNAKQMREVNASEGAFSLKGLIGVGDQAKPTRSMQCFYINGRLIRCPLLSQALEEACKGRVTVNMHPTCVLSLTTPPEAVDINVHPSKLEVRFRDEAAFRLTSQALISQAFIDEKMIGDFDYTKETPVERNQVNVVLPAQPEIPQGKEESTSPQLHRQISFIPKKDETERVFEIPKSTHKREFMVREGAPFTDLSVSPFKDHSASEKAPAISKNAEPRKTEEKQEQIEIATDTLKTRKEAYRLIGSLFKTYILIETEDALLLIDQHAAHERLNYENYKKRLEEGNGSQQLLVPYIVHVSRREAELLLLNADLLKEAGYEIEPFGETDIQVRAVPFVLGQADMRMMFTEIIESLDTIKSAERERRMTDIIQASCKHAVKAGDALTDEEIQNLIKSMRESGAPPTCPHGRPVMRALTRHEIERMFKRIQ